MNIKETFQLIGAIIIGLILGFGIWKAMQLTPCYDGTPIAETPNYCMIGR